MAGRSPTHDAAPEPTWATSVAAVLLNHRSLLERVGELRSRLFKAAGALAVGSLIAWFFYNPILAVIAHPLKSLPGAGTVVSGGKLIFTAPTEAFFVRIKIVAFTGAALASPVVIWQLWRFFTEGVPGIKGRSSRYAIAFVASSVALFAAGTAVAFAFVKPALSIFLYLGGSHITLVPRASEYLSFLMLIVVAFGLTFEYPLFLLGLIFAGVISSTTLRRRRRLAWFVLIVVSAVVTPTVDPITPLALAIPLAVLYEATIFTARLLKR